GWHTSRIPTAPWVQEPKRDPTTYARLSARAPARKTASPITARFTTAERAYLRALPVWRYASKTAMMPVTKMPSKVPAPPIDATGAPRPWILSRFKPHGLLWVWYTLGICGRNCKQARHNRLPGVAYLLYEGMPCS